VKPPGAKVCKTFNKGMTFYYFHLGGAKMKCPECQFDNREVVKFCEECGAKLELKCPNCKAEISLGRKFCGECGHKLIEPSEAPVVDFSEPQSYTPKFLADKILTSRSSIEGERKLVTVLFADVANYTAMSEKLDPEEVHQIMDGCFKILMDEIHKYEGTINQFTGDGVMALFGAPVALEDHAQGACYASLAIQNVIHEYGERIKQDFGVNFTMRIGINSGPVIVGAIGDDLRMDYTAVGDTTNLASRMESLSDPGAIMVSKKTYKIAKDFFEFEPMGKVQVKGKEELQKAYQLVKAGEIGTRIKASVVKGLTKFVGRKNSMATLVEAFERVRSGSGQVVGMVGEAGVGKSRLLFEFVKSLESEDITYLEGRCIHYGETLPYYPFIEVLKKFCRIEETDGETAYREKLKDSIIRLDPAFEASLPFLEDLLALKVEDKTYARMEPDQRRWKTIDAVKNVLIKQSQQKPLVLAIEDLHWIDKSSEELLSRLIIESIVSAKILLLCMYRPEYSHRWVELSYYNRLGLTQLTPKSTTELVEALLEEGSVDEDLKKLILGKAGGNPLFVEELTHNLLDTGAVASSDGTYVLTKKVSEIKVPDSLQAVIAARIDRLEETLKHILQVASVIGREFAFRVLRVILEMKKKLRQYLADLQGLEFIYEKTLFPELEYIFKHALTQEVAYNNLLLQRRKEFHRLAGEAIEKLYAETLQEHLGPLAFHFYRAEAWEKAFKYLTSAGERARFAYAAREAIDYFDKAIEVSRKIPEAVSKEQFMSLYESRGRTWQVLMEWEKAADDFQKEIELARELKNKKIEAQALLNLAQCYATWGVLADINKVRECLDKSRKLIRETGDQAGEVRWNIMAGFQLVVSLGQFNEGATYLQKALDVCRKLRNKRGIGPALGFLGYGHTIMGDPETGIKEARESREIAREIGNQFLLVSSFHWSLLGHGGRGQYDEAFKSLEDLSKGANEIGSKKFIAMVPNHYGWIYSELCNFEKAIVHDKNGLDVSQRLEDPEGEIFSLLNLVGEHIGCGDYDKAQHYLNEVQEKSELQWYSARCWKYDLHFSRYMSELSLLEGNYSKAMEFAEDTLARGQSTPSKKYISMGWKLKGDVLMAMEKVGEAAEHFEKARDLSDQMGYPPLMWKTRFSLGQIYNQQGKYEAAKESLEKASAIIERMASNVSDTEVKETFLNSKPIQDVYKQLNVL
jgi:class 3 adenylate cyclase/tetratricopeptide (TPR) repeat protein